MNKEHALEIQAFLVERYGEDFGMVGVTEWGTVVYAKRFIGQIRRVLTQKFPHRTIRVQRADFIPAHDGSR